MLATHLVACMMSNMNFKEQLEHDIAVRVAKDYLIQARGRVRKSLEALENSHLTADKCGPLHTLMRRIDLWITRENENQKQPSR